MWKRFFVFFYLLSFFVISSVAQERQTETITVTEDAINSFLVEQISQRNLEIEMTASVKGGMVMINLVSRTRPHNDGIIIQISMMPSISPNNARIEWTVVDWSATDLEGNPSDIDETRLYDFVETVQGVWQRAVQQYVRLDKATPILFESITLIEGQIMFETFTGEPTGGNSENNLPSNVTDNGDGTFTILISQEMINNAFAIISERNENISSFMVEIEGINAGHFRIALSAKALCNNEVIESSFQLVPKGQIAALDSSTDEFIVGDWTGDGIDNIATIFIPGRTYAVLGATMTCEGEAFTQEQNQRVMSLLLPAVQRFIRLQTRNSIIVDFRIVGSNFEITVEPPQR